MSSKKVALVTGSTSGIGTAIAHALAAEGCDVIIHGLAYQDTIDKVTQDIQSTHGVEVTYFGGDLRKEEEVGELCKCVKDRCPDGLDILVNNAATGIWDNYPVGHFPMDKWNDILAVNLTAPFMLTQAFVGDMKKKGWGRIVNIASVEGIVGTKYMLSPYTTTKHGLVGMTKSVALEVAQTGVTCNCICPTSVSGTAMFDNWYENRCKQAGEEFRQKVSKEMFQAQVASKNPTNQNCTPEQVAELVSFLCFSAASSQMTGAPYMLDAGWSAQ